MKLFRALFQQARGERENAHLLVPRFFPRDQSRFSHQSGFEGVELPSNREGMVSLEELDKHLNENLAGIMLYQPEYPGPLREGHQVHRGKVYKAGGLLYYDGANSNAIMGKVRPGDMGFDVVHLDLHKTFSTPHGGGGPGADRSSCQSGLIPFLPGPRYRKSGDAYA